MADGIIDIEDYEVKDKVPEQLFAENIADSSYIDERLIHNVNYI